MRPLKTLSQIQESVSCRQKRIVRRMFIPTGFGITEFLHLALGAVLLYNAEVNNAVAHALFYASVDVLEDYY